MISVIIPVYNNETFLLQLFTDILNQTYKDFEVIFINDGSKDNSQLLLQDFCSNNPFATCYFKENGGVSSARNLGLEKAKGDYIVFWDADDYVDKDFLKLMVSNLQKDTLTVCGFSHINDKNEKVDRVLEKSKIVSKNQIAFMQENWFFNALWNKIFVKDIILKNNIKFNENYSVGEDTLFIAEYIKHVKNYLIINSSLYTYVRRQNTAMTKYCSSIYDSHRQIYESIFSSLESEQEDYLECLNQVKLLFGQNCVGNIWHLVANLKNGSKQELKKALKHYNTDKNLIKPKVNILLKILLKLKNITLLKWYYKLFLSRR